MVSGALLPWVLVIILDVLDPGRHIPFRASLVLAGLLPAMILSPILLARRWRVGTTALLGMCALTAIGLCSFFLLLDVLVGDF